MTLESKVKYILNMCNVLLHELFVDGVWMFMFSTLIAYGV